jgi:hypothetical protein
VNQLEPRFGRVLGDVQELPTGEVVQNNHLYLGRSEKTIDEVATDKAGPASHYDTFGPVRRHGLQYSARVLGPPLSQG